MGSIRWPFTAGTKTLAVNLTIWWCGLVTRCCWRAILQIFNVWRSIWNWSMSQNHQPGPTAAIMRRLLLTRCIDADEAFSFIDGRLLALIFSMLAIGAALQSTGAVALIVGGLAPALADLPPFVLIWAIYLITSILTELVSNNAVAVVVTPVAIALGTAIGVDPRPLVVAVMIAASASFATPIGYQTNMLVYGPGGYRFTDFMKVGIPLNLSMGVLVSLAIPYFWPL
jgi:di/tricarboxylate transporter